MIWCSGSPGVDTTIGGSAHMSMHHRLSRDLQYLPLPRRGQLRRGRSAGDEFIYVAIGSAEVLLGRSWRDVLGGAAGAAGEVDADVEVQVLG
jgi:hypothetical protein